MRSEADRLLACYPLPSLGRDLRTHKETIVRQWEQAVCDLLPDADPLTSKAVRDSIPLVLEDLAATMESDDPAATRTLEKTTKAHGITRFHQGFDLKQMIIEYRLLRRITVEALRMASEGRLSVTEVMSLDVGIDIALQQAVTAYVDHLRAQKPAPPGG